MLPLLLLRLHLRLLLLPMAEPLHQHQHQQHQHQQPQQQQRRHHHHPLLLECQCMSYSCPKMIINAIRPRGCLLQVQQQLSSLSSSSIFLLRLPLQLLPNLPNRRNGIQPAAAVASYQKGKRYQQHRFSPAVQSLLSSSSGIPQQVGMVILSTTTRP